MKICILGSTGFLGRVLLRKALEANHEVRVLVRSPEKLGKEYTEKLGDHIVVGNYFDSEAVEKAVHGTQAVISTIGPSPRNQGNPKDYETAMENLVDIMRRNQVLRLIHIGGAVHDGNDEKEEWSLSRRFLRFVLEIVYSPGLEAKRLEWHVLKKADDLQWTLVRPPRIAPAKPRGKLIADEKRLSSLQVWVEDLADFLLELLKSEEWIRLAPLVAAG